MLSFLQTIRLNIILIICAAIVLTDVVAASEMTVKKSGNTIMRSDTTLRSPGLESLNRNLYNSMLKGDTSKSGRIIKLIMTALGNGKTDSLTLSDSYYWIGIYYLIGGRIQQSSGYFALSTDIREKLGVKDSIYSKTLFNIGTIQNSLGDYNKMEQFISKSLEIDKMILGESNPKLAQGYSGLSTAYLGLKDYEMAIEYGKTALKLIEKQQSVLNTEIVTDLYTNLGVCYIKTSDYSKAVIYLENAETLYDRYNIPKGERYINLLNSLAAAYFFLGRTDKSDEYYDKGLRIAESMNTLLSQNFVNSFAAINASAGNIEKGKSILLNSLRKVEKHYTTNSGIYIYVLKNYADYLRKFRIDNKKSLELYEECMVYLYNHREDKSMKSQILMGYAQALADNAYPEKALGLIQNLIFTDAAPSLPVPETDNPDPESIKPDQWSLNLFKVKYRILEDLYEKSSDLKYILAASQTSGLIVSLLEKVRINIDEEDSRLVLGDRYRDFYINAIRDCDICYKKTGRQEYLDKAFEFSERSKSAALLASTRELKATQFSIPQNIADLERRLKTEISYYNAKIEDGSDEGGSDQASMTEWKKRVFQATRERDSLVDMFEKNYPGYYMIKYNTNVLKPSDIPENAGRNTNYISYVVSNDVIYLFLVNRKKTFMTTISIDSLFFENISEFRKLLSAPSLLNNAKNDYLNYQKLGNYICNLIFRPVKKYLISDRLLISPDNILSYIPFEVLPDSVVSQKIISYKSLPYLTKKYVISYTYSATFLSESVRKCFSPARTLLAFAPSYSGTLNVDSILAIRKERLSGLTDLPFARMEAEFACRFIGGRLYLNGDAKESVFKDEAGKYDIIHLAMHTIVNDKNPMLSKMIFSDSDGSPEDGMLNTYEVYGTPLNAKMVVLSSCNTGMGHLHSGEGVLSLARGFIYAGSQSVIMSLWEIEDKSGTEVIENFYRFLKKGYTKSDALRSARLKYLRNADMMKSHPYFWSTLVIYGIDDNLFYPVTRISLAAGIVLLLLSGIFLLYRRLR